jgi:hypothetical protein
MRVCSACRGSKRDVGRNGEKHGGGKGDTQGLFHGGSPFSGANLRKMSLAPFLIVLKEEKEAKLRKCEKRRGKI